MSSLQAWLTRAIDVHQMVPSTAHAHPDRPGSQLLLELDAWATDKWRDSLDITAVGSVTGSFDF
jgi:hypothetical protein